MSWSISKLGKAGAVATSLATSFESVKKQYPSGAEHDQVVAAENLIGTFLTPLQNSTVVKIDASGSVTLIDGNVHHGNLKIDASTVYGFVE